jgi:hypothetical protein
MFGRRFFCKHTKQSGAHLGYCCLKTVAVYCHILRNPMKYNTLNLVRPPNDVVSYFIGSEKNVKMGFYSSFQSALFRQDLWKDQGCLTSSPPTKGDWYNVVRSEHYGSKESNEKFTGSVIDPEEERCYVINSFLVKPFFMNLKLLIEIKVPIGKPISSMYKKDFRR